MHLIYLLYKMLASVFVCQCKCDAPLASVTKTFFHQILFIPGLAAPSPHQGSLPTLHVSHLSLAMQEQTWVTPSSWQQPLQSSYQGPVQRAEPCL